MNYIKFNFYSIIMVLSVIILSGCNSELLTSASSNEEVNIEYDLLDYPIAVRNGDVSPEYYDNMIGVINSYVDLLNSVGSDPEDYITIEDAGRDYLTEVTTYNPSPSTSIEYDLDEYLTEYIIQTKMVAEYYIDYATKKDDVYLKLAKDSKDDALNTGNTMVSIGNKYGLNKY